VNKIKYFCTRLYTMLYGKFHRIEKKIMFESFHGEQYSDNPRAISEKLHEMHPDFEIVWALNRVSKEIKKILPEYVRVINRKSINYYREFATSFGYVTNEGIVPNIYKRKQQFFVQTWHGDRGCKKVLYEAHGSDNSSYKLMDPYFTDICISGSKFGESIYRKAFRYNGEIMSYGMPRNDKLIECSKSEVEEIRNSLDIPKDTKVLLYAPTFRDSGANICDYIINIEKTLDCLEMATKNKWVCLFRDHPTRKSIDFNTLKRAIQVSTYPDMRDLLLVADMLITDYSSSAGDFCITKKPIIHAAYDYREYITLSREMKVNFYDTGFIIAESQDDLESKIRDLKEEDYKASDDKAIEFFGINETGQSSTLIANRIAKEWRERS